MTTYTQARRGLAVLSPLGLDALLLEKFSGREALSELFCFHLELLAPQPIPFEKVLGQLLTVELAPPGQPKRVLSGIVSRLRQGEEVSAASGLSSFVRYHAELVPEFWRLTRRVRSRVFQRKTVLEMLNTVLKDEGKLRVVFELASTSAYLPHHYCVQYQESDFAFASRLMEEEGLYYFFRHTDEGEHQLVIRDDSPQSMALPGVEMVPYRRRTEPYPGLRVWSWHKEQEVCAGLFALEDFNHAVPGQRLRAEKALADTVPAGQVKHALNAGSLGLEVHEYPAGYAHRFDSLNPSGTQEADDFEQLFQVPAPIAQLRMEEAASHALSIEGAGDAAGFAPGFQFTLAGHFDGDGSYVLTEVEHSASLKGVYTKSEEEAFAYENRFRCVPVELRYRPARRTPRPRIDGIQTAEVVGLSQQPEEIYCDKFGRIKVQFHWDRSRAKNADSSCWVRVAQPWAGKRWGTLHIPRVGQEVVVAFRNGDPDEPVILGGLHNAENPPPFDLPRHSTLTGYRTHTPQKDAPEFNGLLFDDAAGQEETMLRAQRDLLLHAGNDAIISARGDLDYFVAGQYAEHLGLFPGTAAPGNSSSSGNSSKPATSATSEQKPAEQQSSIKTAEAPKATKAEEPPAGPWADFSNADKSLSFSIAKPNLKMSMGLNAKADFGLNFAVGVGGGVKVDVNPFALAGRLPAGGGQLLGKLFPTWAKPLELLGTGGAGSLSALLGANLGISLGGGGSKFEIGPSIKYSRGDEYTLKGAFATESKWGNILANRGRDLAAHILANAITASLVATQACIGKRDQPTNIALISVNSVVGAATLVYLLTELSFALFAPKAILKDNKDASTVTDIFLETVAAYKAVRAKVSTDKLEVKKDGEEIGESVPLKSE
jgi:type VI secretion system secreted protein VgrG